MTNARQRLGLLLALVVGLIWSSPALGQDAPCGWGIDPVTLRCRDKPAAPPPPPSLALDSVPIKAQVYPVAAPRGSIDACQWAGPRPVGETPLTIRPDQGLHAGKQIFCFKLEGFAPATVTAIVGPSGLTTLDPVQLVPFARVAFEWSPGCSYRAAPEAVDLAFGEHESRHARLFPDSVPLPPGKYPVVFSAEGFKPNEVSVDVGHPGSPQARKSICLEPTARFTIRNERDRHPLDGLFLQVKNLVSKAVLWQGPAPVKDAAVEVPVRPSDLKQSLDVSAFVDNLFNIEKPYIEVSVQGEPADGHVTEFVWIKFPEPTANEDLDRKRMTATCTDPRSSLPDYCAAEAYLRIHVDKSSITFEQAMPMLRKGCANHRDVASCAALVSHAGPAIIKKLHSSDPSDPGGTWHALKELATRIPDLAAATNTLQEACKNPGASLRWLACLSVQQFDLPGDDLLYADDRLPTVSHSKADVTAEVAIRLEGYGIIAPRPGTFSSYVISVEGFLVPQLGVGGGIRLPYEWAALPAQTTKGAPDGYVGMADTGLDLIATYKPAGWVRFDLVGFIAGYYTKSASLRGGSIDVAFALARAAGGSSAVHWLTFAGGIAAFPVLVEVTPGTRTPQGDVLQAFAGLGYLLAFPQK